MQKIFWDNPYQTVLQTHVTQVNGDEILLDATIAYSFAGGQESDRAWINGLEIVNSRRENNLIFYTLPAGHNLHVGDQVKLEIDWPRRLCLMRLHFAAELILEIVTRNWGYEKIGAHISQAKSRIDFLAPENVSAKFTQIIDEYNQIIEKNLPIITDFSDRDSQRRFWKIEGFAQVPCGGTHVKTTGEVGYVTLKREKPGKSVERIEIRLRS